MVTNLMFLFELNSHKTAVLHLGIESSNSSLIHRNALNMVLLVMFLIGDWKFSTKNVRIFRKKTYLFFFSLICALYCMLQILTTELPEKEGLLININYQHTYFGH